MLAIYFLSCADFGFCDYDITQTDSGSYTWEETEGNMEVSHTCALGAAMEVSMQDAVARRMCNVFAEWEDPNAENCISIVSRQFQDLNTVSMTRVTLSYLHMHIHIDIHDVYSYCRKCLARHFHSIAT